MFGFPAVQQMIIPRRIEEGCARPGKDLGVVNRICPIRDQQEGSADAQQKMAAAMALANLISDEELNEDYIIPAAFDERVGPAVAKAVAEAARKTGVARI